MLLAHGLGLLALGVQNAELELGAHLALETGDEQQVEREVVLALFVEAARIHAQAPLELVVAAGAERGRLERLADLLAAEREVVYGPHVAELDHLHLGHAPVLGERRVRHGHRHCRRTHVLHARRRRTGRSRRHRQRVVRGR